MCKGLEGRSRQALARGAFAMGNTCSCIRQSSVQGNSCSSYLSAQSASGGGATRIEATGGSASVEEQIEQSKSHWRLLADQSDVTSDDDEVAEESNKRVFQTLQLHPIWGRFYRTFGYDFGAYESMRKLRVGKKFAEGGQAELFLAQVTWSDSEYNEWYVEHGVEWVVTVFKRGTFLRHLQRQFPNGYLQFHVEQSENWESPTPKRYPRFHSHMERGILLKDGRFAFWMKKEDFDLRTLIEHKMRLRNGKACGPFPKEAAELIMYQVALGLDWLHGQDIVYRDLKASNVLVHKFESGRARQQCFVADYECSIGIMGTGFFRAQEILQACKKVNVNIKHDVCTKAVDVYCYHGKTSSGAKLC